METITTPDEPKKARGRPAYGILPADYNHALLLETFHTRRRMDLTAVCKSQHISRQHFYDIINGRVSATRDRVEVVAKILSVDVAEVLPTEN